MNNKLILSSAIAGLVALSSFSVGAAPAEKKDAKEAKEKCYGVAAKGANDCGTAKHSCAGQSEKANDPTEWKFVAKGSCEKMGGVVKKAKPARPSDASAPNYGG